MQDILQKAKEFLEKLNKYGALLKETAPGFVFEILFAYFLEMELIQLEYEVKVNPSSEKSIDFLHRTQSRNHICFELHRPDSDDEIERSWQSVTDPDSGQIYGYALELSSDNPNDHLRPEAQTI